MNGIVLTDGCGTKVTLGNYLPQCAQSLSLTEGLIGAISFRFIVTGWTVNCATTTGKKCISASEEEYLEENPACSFRVRPRCRICP